MYANSVSGWHRLRLNRAGVRVDRLAVLIGGKGISLKQGTEIHRNAIVAAGYISGRGDFVTPPRGSVDIGHRCVLMPGAMVVSYGGRIVIGDDVSINPYCVLAGQGGLVIGSNTRIAANTMIVSSSHIYDDRSVPIRRQGMSKKGVRIGDDVWIGSGVTILDGVTIGDGAVVGAGSVVNRDVAPWAVVAGVPARPIKTRGA
jgi:acetyltransferase-like isoleucine patch superfamily enzyme